MNKEELTAIAEACLNNLLKHTEAEQHFYRGAAEGVKLLYTRLAERYDNQDNKPEQPSKVEAGQPEKKEP